MDKLTTAKRLRLLAHDDEDLQVMSAALQDAIAHVGDIRYEPAARRITVLFNRYRWELDENEPDERVCAALQLGDVSRVRRRGLDRAEKGALIYCLALDFEPGDPPGGSVMLRFSGGHDLQISVDCIDAVLADVSEPWSARCAPDHAVDKTSDAGQTDAGQADAGQTDAGQSDAGQPGEL